MQLGISSYSYSWAVGVKGFNVEKPMRLIDLIERTRAFGLHLLQIGDNLPLDELEQSELNAARDALRAYGITLEIGIRGLLDEQMDAYIKLCKFFSAHILRVVIDKGSFEPTEDEIVEILARWAPVLERSDVTLAIENHDRLKVMQFVRILRRVHSDRIGICLDTANSLGALEGLETVLNALVPYTVNFHAKDITIARLPSQLGFQITGTVSGEGMLNMMSIINCVRNNGHDANCILEQWTPFTNTIEETIAREAADARAGVDNLRRFLRQANCLCDDYSLLERRALGGDGSGVYLEQVRIRGEMRTQMTFSAQRDLLDFAKSAASEALRAGDYAVIDRLYVPWMSEQLLRGKDDDSARKDSAVSLLLQVAAAMPGRPEIIIPLGPLNTRGEKMTIGALRDIEEGYFLPLSEFVKVCEAAEIPVGFHLLPDGFVDNGLILLEEMEHYNIKRISIYTNHSHGQNTADMKEESLCLQS